MGKFAFVLSIFMLLGMIFGAIDRALAPYEDAFYHYGLLLSIAFIALLWGVGLDDRLTRMENDPPSKSPKQPV